MKMIYDPEPLLGLHLLKQQPIEVEVVERGDHVSLIRRPVPANSIVNIVRKHHGQPVLTTMVVEVPNDWLKPLQ